MQGSVELLKKPYYRFVNTLYPYIKYTSVSKLKRSVIKKFDAVKMAEKCSSNPNHEHFGKHPDDIQTIWNLKGDKSRAYGDFIHAIVEKHIKSPCFSFLGDDNLERNIIHSFKKCMEEVENELSHLGFEYTYGSIKSEVNHHLAIRSNTKYDGKYLTAKMIDKLIQTDPQWILDKAIEVKDKIPNGMFDNIGGVKEAAAALKVVLINVGLATAVDVRFDAPNFFSVIDLKTDEKITFDSWNKKECLLPPMDSLKACKTSEYGLQTALGGVLGNQMDELKGKLYHNSYIFHWDNLAEEFTVIRLGNYYQHARLLMAKYFKLM